jgi:hypothetical protein
VEGGWVMVEGGARSGMLGFWVDMVSFVLFAFFWRRVVLGWLR